MNQLPKYRCHKEVEAVKIARLSHTKRVDGGFMVLSAGNYLIPCDPNIKPIILTPEYIRKHDPQPGGYYVRYADGYESYSPAEAFESGYTRIGAEEPPARQMGAYAEHAACPCAPPVGKMYTTMCGRMYGAAVCRLGIRHLGWCVTEIHHFSTPRQPRCDR